MISFTAVRGMSLVVPVGVLVRAGHGAGGISIRLPLISVILISHHLAQIQSLSPELVHVEKILCMSLQERSWERVRYSNSFVNFAGFAKKLPSLTSIWERSDIEKGAWT